MEKRKSLQTLNDQTRKESLYQLSRRGTLGHNSVVCQYIRVFVYKISVLSAEEQAMTMQELHEVWGK
jgi:hypothetical protein